MANHGTKQYEPDYICWHETEFMADRLVVRMTPHQRLMYRSLCQAAMFCSTRPYLPDVDTELYVLADADTLEQWKQNRDAVLVKFYPVEIDGKPMLAHKRLLADWDRIIEIVNQKRAAASSGGKARAKQMASTSQADAAKLKLKAETEIETEIKTENKQETEIETANKQETEIETETANRNGNSKGAVADGVSEPGQQGYTREDQERYIYGIAALFENYVPNGADPQLFTPLLPSNQPQKIASAMRWAFTRSSGWGSGKPAEITSAEQFVRAFPEIAKQYDKYYASAAKKPHEVDNDFSEPDSEHPPMPDEDDVELSKIFEVE
jgi:uncharacterized protein YdaU (DUF1376 family)